MTVIDPPARPSLDRPSAEPAAASPPAGVGPGRPVPGRRTRRRLRDRVVEALTLGAKAATVVCAIDAVLHHDSPRLRGKAIRTRAIGYTAGLLIVPIAWRLLPDRGEYPRGLDLAVTAPLLIDAGGNALGLYETAHLDDVVHFANAGIVAAIAGSLFGRRVDEPWQAAVAGAGVAVAAETAWEVAEYVAWRLGADGMNLTYEDSMADLAESALGAVAGGLYTFLRMPRDASVRRRSSLRRAVSGWSNGGGGGGRLAPVAARPVTR